MEYVLITVRWFFLAIMMQFWETLLWENYKCKLITKFAMINKVIQTVLLLFCLLIPGYIKKNNINTKYIVICLGLYFCYMLPIIMKDYGCIITDNGINLAWWSNIKSFIVLHNNDYNT